MTTEANNEWNWDIDPLVPKETWPPGPWHDEPDKLVWVDENTDLDCMIVRGPSGALCGYVGVTEDHPYFRKEYKDVDLHAHHGVNYSEECQGNICHLPRPGQGEVWWFGFDCAHYSDYCPKYAVIGPMFAQHDGETYKTVDYVKRECEMLAHQLKEAS
jgi:hypothetical protein